MSMTTDEILKTTRVDVNISIYDGLVLFDLLDVIGRRMMKEHEDYLTPHIHAIADFVVSFDEGMEKSGIDIDSLLDDDDDAENAVEKMKKLINNQNG